MSPEKSSPWSDNNAYEVLTGDCIDGDSTHFSVTACISSVSEGVSLPKLSSVITHNAFDALTGDSGGSPDASPYDSAYYTSDTIGVSTRYNSIIGP